MINKFWSWFQQAEAEIREDIDTKNEIGFILNELGAQLNVISHILGYEIRKNKSPKKARYTQSISCDGKKDYFILVKTIIEYAPKLPYWEFKSFISAKGNPEKLMKKKFKYDSCVLIPNTIKFSVTDYSIEEDIYDLILLLPVYLRQVGEEELMKYLYFLFQDLWGEEFVGRIDAVTITYYNDDSYCFLELEDLHFFIDNFELVMGFQTDLEEE